MPEEPGGKYLYCILRASEPLTINTRGVGEYGDHVYTIHVHDLAAVVSDSPIIEYDQSRRNLLAHTQVQEAAMQHGVILPVRFGIIAPAAAAVEEQLLRRRYDEIDAILRKLDGMLEVGLKAFWYEGAIFQEIIATHKDIRALRDSLLNKSADETYYERIRLGQMIEQAMNEQREADAEQVLARLRPLARDTQLSKTITERMVLNAAFLIEQPMAGAFEQAVHQIDQELGERLLFKYIPASPPYHFVDLTLQWEEKA